MIIKGLFRRYERWNPVHPTYGAFWGMGVGLGCGVGWGPGFGPEVIGYVGAGCGVGFSVGITFLGLGIGLPANYVFTVPYSAVMVTRQGALELARASGVLGNKDSAGDGWGDLGIHISDVHQNPRAMFPSFKIDNPMENMVDFGGVGSMLVSQAKHVSDFFERGSRNFFPWDRDAKS